MRGIVPGLTTMGSAPNDSGADAVTATTAKAAAAKNSERSSLFILPLQISERLFDFAFRLGRGRYQRQSRRTTVVAIQVHRIFEAGDAELRGDQRRRAADAVLPVQAGRLLAGLVGLPNGDRRIRRRVGVGQDRPASAHQ